MPDLNGLAVSRIHDDCPKFNMEKKKIIKFPPSWPKPEKKNPIKIGATSFIDPFYVHVNNNTMEKVALY